MEKPIKINIEELELYEKKRIIVHYLKSIDVAPKDTLITINTLEGPVNISSNEHTYILMGPCDDVYPISKTLFETRYEVLEQEMDKQEMRQIIKHGWNPEKVRACINIKKSYVYAKQMREPFAVYVKWCNALIHGEPGDFYAVSYEDLENAYIINKDIMQITYEKVAKEEG